jgi:hypothetical protein
VDAGIAGLVVSFNFVDATVRAGWLAATTQPAQLAAVTNAWAGVDVRLRYYSAAGVLLGTATHDALGLFGTTELYLMPGALLTWSYSTGGTAAYCIAAIVDGADILRCDVALDGPINSASRVNLGTGAGAGLGLRIEANPALPVSALPAWRSGQGVNEWVEILGSSMSASPPSVNPGRASGVINAILDAWCGLSIDTRSSRVWSPANGGHDDTHENGSRYLDLPRNSPVWVEVTPSNAAAEFDFPNDAPYYSNGRPSSRHSYYSQQFIEARNRAMMFGAPAVSTTGNTFKTIDGFNCNAAIGTNGFDPAGTYPDLPAYETGMAVCKNTTTEDVYVFNFNNAVYQWTQATNVVTTINDGFPPDTANAATAYDNSRSVVFLVNAAGAWTFDPATGIFTARTLTGSYVSQVRSNQGGMVYVPERDKYLLRSTVGSSTAGAEAGPNVYVVDPTTWATSLLSVTGGSTIPGGVGSLGGGSPFNKLLRVPAYGGVVWIPSYTSNAWFLRTH